MEHEGAIHHDRLRAAVRTAPGHDRQSVKSDGVTGATSATTLKAAALLAPIRGAVRYGIM